MGQAAILWIYFCVVISVLRGWDKQAAPSNKLVYHLKQNWKFCTYFCGLGIKILEQTSPWVPSWSQIRSDPPASSSWVLGLQVDATTCDIVQ